MGNQASKSQLSTPNTVTIVPGEEGRLERALSGFVDRVREAALVYDRDRAENAGRRGCMVALTAAIDFCQALGLSANEDRTFFRLLLALQNAEAGGADELLVRTKLGVKAAPSVVVMRQRGYVAAAVEALLKDNITLTEATNWVGEKSKQLVAFESVKASRSRSSIVKGWRDEARAGEYRVDVDKTTFADACAAMEITGLRGKSAAERLLSDAAEIG